MEKEEFEALLADTRARLRAAYVERRQMHVRVLKQGGSVDEDEAETLHPKWDGGVDSRGARHSGCWGPLAHYAIKNKVDPVLWVDALFSLSHAFDHTPYPTDLRNPMVLKALATFEADRAKDLHYRILTERLTLAKEVFFRLGHSAMSEEAVVRAVLADPTIDVSAITRYEAALERAPDLAERLEPMALLQYRSAADSYRAAMGGVPGKLEQLSAALDEAKHGEVNNEGR